MILGHPPAGPDVTPDYRDPDAMRRLLADWTARGWLRELDRTFAEFLWREAPDAHPLPIHRVPCSHGWPRLGALGAFLTRKEAGSFMHPLFDALNESGDSVPLRLVLWSVTAGLEYRALL